MEFELVRDERLDAIRQHVMALPERQRAAVLMHKYQDMDYKQIGEVLKLSEVCDQVASLSRLPDAARKAQGFCGEKCFDKLAVWLEACMNCGEMNSKLADLLLDPGSSTLESRRHLEECAGCREELAELRSTMAFMDEWGNSGAESFLRRKAAGETAR